MIYYTKNQIDDLRTVIAAKDAENARLTAAKDAEIARLREALSNLLAVAEGQGGTKYHAHDIARAALAPVEAK